MLVQSLKPEVNATQLLTQAGIIPTPPHTDNVHSSVICSEGTKTADDFEKAEKTRTGVAVEQRERVEHQLLDTRKHTEEPTVQQDEVLQIVRQINTEVEPNSTAEVPNEVQVESISMEAEKANAAKQPLLTPKEVAANLVTGNLEATEMDMGADGDYGLNSTERVEGTTDETLGRREVVYEKEMNKRASPRDEVTRVGAATVRTYQRRLAREKSSGRKSAEEKPRRTSGERAGDYVHSAVGPPRRRRRVLIDEEPEEFDNIIFTLIEALPSSGQVNPPAKENDIERERSWLPH